MSHIVDNRGVIPRDASVSIELTREFTGTMDLALSGLETIARLGDLHF
jgi:hypothetical protein